MSRPLYLGGSFHGIVKSPRYSNFYMTPFTATNTVWYPIRDTGTGAQNLVLSYTGYIGQTIQFTARINCCYNSVVGQYMYFDIHKATAQPAYATTSVATSIITNATCTTSAWGAHLIGPNVYQGVHFTATYTFTANETQLFYLVFRTQSTATIQIGSNTVGVNAYAELQAETLF